MSAQKKKKWKEIQQRKTREIGLVYSGGICPFCVQWESHGRCNGDRGRENGLFFFLFSMFSLSISGQSGLLPPPPSMRLARGQQPADGEKDTQQRISTAANSMGFSSFSHKEKRARILFLPFSPEIDHHLVLDYPNEGCEGWERCMHKRPCQKST